MTNSGAVEKAPRSTAPKNVAEERYQRDKRRRGGSTRRRTSKRRTAAPHYDVLPASWTEPEVPAPSRLRRAPTTWDRLAASGPVYSGTIAGKRGPRRKLPVRPRRHRPSPCGPRLARRRRGQRRPCRRFKGVAARRRRSHGAGALETAVPRLAPARCATKRSAVLCSFRAEAGDVVAPPSRGRQ